MGKMMQNDSHFTFDSSLNSLLLEIPTIRVGAEYVRDAGLGTDRCPYPKSPSAVITAAIISSPLPLEGRAIMSNRAGRLNSAISAS